MIDAGLVFVLGTALSFPLLYWAISRRIAASRKAKARVDGQRPLTAAGREFLGLLRREALRRVDVVMSSAIEDASETAKITGNPQIRLPAMTQERIEETGRLVSTLFSRNVASVYAARIGTLMGGEDTDPAQLAAARRAILDALALELARPAPPRQRQAAAPAAPAAPDARTKARGFSMSPATA